MLLKRIIAGLVVAVIVSGGAMAEPSITGGGVGSVGCPEFLHAMQTARQGGGLGSPTGVRATNGFLMYVLGFQTGFNWGANVHDIFDALGQDGEHGHRILYAMEPYCANHPDKHFDDALFDLVAKLKP